MEELARRRAELIIVTLDEEEEETKAKADGIARRARIIGRMLAEADGDWAGLRGSCCCSNISRIHALRVEKKSFGS